MTLIIGIILGILACRALRRAWIAFQIRELEIRSGTLRSKEVRCQPVKWGKQLKCSFFPPQKKMWPSPKRGKFTSRPAVLYGFL